MAGSTSVDVQGMTAAQASFQNALDQMNASFSNMSEQQSNLQANWAGETASTFGNALNQWLEDFSTVRSQLSQMLEVLSTNTGVYANTNENSQQAASSFSGGLGGVPGLGI
jgi:WXG100 family type VII secretion target